MIKRLGTSDDGFPVVLATLTKFGSAALHIILDLAEQHLDEDLPPGDRRLRTGITIGVLRDAHKLAEAPDPAQRPRPSRA